MADRTVVINNRHPRLRLDRHNAEVLVGSEDECPGRCDGVSDFLITCSDDELRPDAEGVR